jgi:hypothetical protein
MMRAAAMALYVLVASGYVVRGNTALAASQVELTLVERGGVDRVAAPVTSGVPLPKGALADVNNVRLLQGDKEVPAQFRAVGLWRPASSIKWLLVDFQVDVKANEKQVYTLEYGPGVSAEARPAVPVNIAETDAAYTVTTGAATFRINKKVFTLFDSVTLGEKEILKNSEPAGVLSKMRKMATRAIPGAKNGGRSHLVTVLPTDRTKLEDYTLTFTTDRGFKVVGAKAGPAGKGTWRKDFKSADGGFTIPGKQWLPYHYPKKGDMYTFRTVPTGSSFTSEAVFSTTVLEHGPMRSVVQVKGSFGPTTAPAMEFTARYHFYAGSGRVKLFFTLENNDFGGRTGSGNADNCNIGGINCVFFDEMALVLPLKLSPKAACLLIAGPNKTAGSPLRNALELYQDSSGFTTWNRYRNPKYHPRPNSYVTFRGYKIFGGELEVIEGDQAIGYLDATDGEHGVSVDVRDFWQNFPKSLATTKDGAVRIGLFPRRYAGDFAFRSGEHKTHEILLDFSRRAAGSHGYATPNTVSLASNPLRLEPSAQWIARTRALGDLHPYDMDNYKAYEIRNLSFIGVFPEGVKKGPSALSRREQMNFYGWMDYGDFPMDFEGGSGQWGMKYDLDYHLAVQWARSLRPTWWDLFIAASKHHCDIDVHHQPHYPWIHYVKGGSWAHSQHNERGHVNPNRNRGRFTKDLCFGARGAATRYYLTGDAKAAATVIEQADNALARYMSPQKEPDTSKVNRMGWRGDACTLNRLLEGYLLTGEQKYLTRARWLIKSCAFDGKPAKHRSVSLWSSTFFMMALARYVEMFPDDRDARSWLLAHLGVLRKASDRPDCMMYTVKPHADGTVTGKGQCSMYNLMGADALMIGYRLTRDQAYLDLARKCFAYGVRNACWKNGPPTYFHIHSANGALHGQVFMARDAALRERGS